MNILNRFLMAAVFFVAGTACAAPNDSFESGLTNWSVVGVATPGPTFTTSGVVGIIAPTDGAAMAVFNCANCGDTSFIHYDFSPALTVGINDYVALDVFSDGTDRNLYLRMSDGTQWVTLGTNNTAQFEAGTCVEDGIVGNGRWEILYSKAADGVAGVTLTTITQVEVIIPGISSTASLYLDNIRVLTAGASGICSGVPTPTPGTPTTPGTPGTPGTPTTPTTVTSPVDCGTFTCTPTSTTTPTFTVTTTATLTPTPTFTPFPLDTFPNPIDFQEMAPDSTGKTIDFQCHGGAGEIPSNLFGCVKINGVERGTTLKIYTISLSHVRTFTVDDTTAVFPAPDRNDYDRGLPNNGNPAVGQIVWDGTNENRNPVAAGLYFYTYEGGSTGKVIGKFAIKRARK